MVIAANHSTIDGSKILLDFTNSTKLVATMKPRKRLPLSPKKILRLLLFEKLKNRNTIKLDTKTRSKSLVDSLNSLTPKINRANNEIITKIEARPSHPSIILVAFVRPMIANNVSGTDSKPNSRGADKPSGMPKLVITDSVIIINVNAITVWNNNFENAGTLNMSSIRPNRSMEPAQPTRAIRSVEEVSKKMNDVKILARKIDIPPILGI